MIETQPRISCKLRREKQLRVLEGHPWIYRSDVASYEGTFEPGDLIQVLDADGGKIGIGFVNPLSKLAIQLLTHDSNEAIDKTFFERRMATAQRLRERRVQASDSYRVLFSGADGLPGFIADKYEDFLVIQILTRGMESFREIILEVLAEQFQPHGIYEKSQGYLRNAEGLEERVGVAYGAVPDLLPIRLHHLTHLVDMSQGQNTGCFLDQRDNQQVIARYVLPGNKVLNVHTYTGGFALIAASRGGEVLALDTSERAIQIAREAISRNSLAAHCHFEQGALSDAFSRFETQSFDVVMLDPPAHAKTKVSLRHTTRNYRHINASAIQLVKSGGILVSTSRSHLISSAEFFNLLRTATAQAEREITILEVLGQSWDFPVTARWPESQYLNCVVARVI